MWKSFLERGARSGKYIQQEKENPCWDLGSRKSWKSHADSCKVTEPTVGTLSVDRFHGRISLASKGIIKNTCLSNGGITETTRNRDTDKYTESGIEPGFKVRKRQGQMPKIRSKGDSC